MAKRVFRFGLVSPLPPDRSGVARATLRLLPHYAALAEVETFAAIARPPARPLSEIPDALEGLDGLLVEVGNSRAHRGFFAVPFRHPAVIELHDLVIHHAILDETIQSGRRLAYRRWLERAVDDGIATSLYRAVDRGFGGRLLYFEVPLLEPLLRTALGVVVHSRYAQEWVRARHPSVPILDVGLPVAASRPSRGRDDVRQGWGFEPEDFVVGALGFATPSKRVDVLVDAIASLRERAPRCRIVVVGEAAPEARLQEIVDAAGVADRVVFTGPLDDAEYDAALEACDVVNALRQPHAGETSLPAYEALARGKPVVANAAGSFAELPDEAVIRVPMGEGASAVLADALERLAADPRRLAAMGAAGRAWVARRGRPEAIARSVVAFLELLAPSFHRVVRAAIDSAPESIGEAPPRV